MNECIGELVTQCFHCEKRLLPYLYFDERSAMGLSLPIKDFEFKSRLPHSEYPPLKGLSSYWIMEE